MSNASNTWFCALTLNLIALAVLSSGAAAGNEDPEGCDGAATGIAIEALLDGSPTLDPVIQDQLLFYRVSIFQPLPNGCNYAGGQLSVTLPDGTIVPLAGFGNGTPDVPIVSFLAPFVVVSPVPYIVDEAHADNGVLTARADFGGTVNRPMQVNGSFQTDPVQQSASATTSLPVPLGALDVQKEPSADTVCAGDVVIYTYTVTTGPGIGVLSDVMVMDDQCADVTFVGGDDNGNTMLDPDEAWIYECASILLEDTTNTVTVLGMFEGNGVGIMDTAQATVTVEPVPSAAITGPVEACPGQTSLMFMATENSMPPLPGATFEWTIEGDASFCAMTPDSMGPMVCVNADVVCDGSFRLTVVVTVGDCTSESTHDVIVRDDEAPRLACPANLVFSCDAVGDFGTATAFDLCDPAPMLAVAEVTSAGACPQEMTITRTWTVTDACGNADTCVQVISIVDDTPPTCAPPADVTIGCDQPTDPGATGVATGNDACGPVTVTSDDTLTPGACPPEMTIVRTWTVTDACGNASTCVQTITVVDEAPPTCEAPADVTVECDGSTDPAATGEAGGIDACGTVTATFTDAVAPGNGPVESTITRTWTTTDSCGNTATCIQIITTLRCPGACCLEDGTCVEVPEAECDGMTGEFNGDGTACADPDIVCEEPEGACCLSDGSCQVASEAACEAEGGDYQGDDVPCTDVQCPCLDALVISWDLDACLAWSDGDSYAEFTPAFDGDCEASASILFREQGDHSCVRDRFGQFSNPSAMCFPVPNSLDSFQADSPHAARVSVTLPGPAQLRELRFWQSSPLTLFQTNESGTGVNAVPNDPLNFFGVRVTRDGAEVFQMIGLSTTTDWTQQTFAFPAAGFEVASGETATFEVELLPYNDENSIVLDFNAWELDDVELESTCCVDIGACCLTDRTCIEVSAAACADLGGEHQGAGTRCGDTVCPCLDLVEITWDLDACYAQTNDGTSYDYGEFTPSIDGDCNDAEATILYREQGPHSCTTDRNGQPGRAMCVGTPFGTSAFAPDDPQAVRFAVTVDGPTTLGGLRFWQAAPNQFAFTAWHTGTGWQSGPNNPPQLYGVRVLRDGVEIFRQEDVPTSPGWSLETWEFDGGGFSVANGETATFDFELFSYDHDGTHWYDGGLITAWDLDDIAVEICCDGTPTGACCLGDQSCTETDEWACVEDLAGLYLGNGVACADVDCPDALAVMFVVVDETSLTAQEQIRRGALESWGMIVSPLTSTSPASAYDALAGQVDVAYVSEEITSADVGTKLTDVVIGVVNEEQALVDELRFGAQGVEVGTNWIDVTVVAHPITAVFGDGPLVITDSTQMLVTLGSPIASGGALLARTNTGVMTPSMMAFEVGGALYPSGTAAGRRVQLPFGSSSFDCDELNANGRTLLQRSLLWAGGSPLPAPLTTGTYRRTTSGADADGFDGAGTPGAPDPGVCAGDLNGDGVVDEVDVDGLMLDWGPQPGGHPGDLDENGVIDADDVVRLVLRWGTCD